MKNGMEVRTWFISGVGLRVTVVVDRSAGRCRVTQSRSVAFSWATCMSLS